MPQFRYPGVYVEEPHPSRNATGCVSTSTVAFAGQPIALWASWDDLILPEPQLEMLRGIAAAARSNRKREAPACVTALFSGEVGTGRTLAAEILAQELDRPLYCIDLSKVVCTYISETEKNLCQIFEAGGQSGAIVFFDETDARIGERTEVKDGHDRYANIEINYLLQRMETYRGLAVLTTNRKSVLDEVVVRRLRFVVSFPMPDAEARARIWRRVMAKQMVAAELNVDELAAWPLSGGRIRDAVVRSAVLAAEEGVAVRMRHLREAIRAEPQG